ncbi:MAG: hypothetical protein M0Q91_16740 [Methanoregula sp.]|nr:hypothetical protein [Methanoregula sp.]
MELKRWLRYIYFYCWRDWEECTEPHWIRRNSLYGRTLFIKGRTFEYKIIGQSNWSQGHDPTICYRRMRKDALWAEAESKKVVG